MKIIKSKLKKDKILHIVYRKNDFKERQDIINPKNFIQLASIVLKKNQTFQAHKHFWKKINYEKTIAQESWVVIRGKVKVIFYDTNNKLLYQTILNSGDCSITLEGGHNYVSLTNNTLVYEFKSGPYYGQIKDKVFIND
tara:strand:- start:1329 stop:1745 length:417 start_codon:yes stop_codon:yes gene_type:complete